MWFTTLGFEDCVPHVADIFVKWALYSNLLHSFRSPDDEISGSILSLKLRITTLMIPLSIYANVLFGKCDPDRAECTPKSFPRLI